MRVLVGDRPGSETVGVRIGDDQSTHDDGHAVADQPRTAGGFDP